MNFKAQSNAIGPRLETLQLYMAEQVAVRNGTLVLTTAKKTVYSGQNSTILQVVDTRSKVSQRFGFFEVRAKLPEQNAWNCWPVGGEIDIMEATGGEENNTVYGTYHWGHNTTTAQLPPGAIGTRATAQPLRTRAAGSSSPGASRVVDATHALGTMAQW